jgi:hypothetical protein
MHSCLCSSFLEPKKLLVFIVNGMLCYFPPSIVLQGNGRVFRTLTFVCSWFGLLFAEYVTLFTTMKGRKRSLPISFYSKTVSILLHIWVWAVTKLLTLGGFHIVFKIVHKFRVPFRVFIHFKKNNGYFIPRFMEKLEWMFWQFGGHLVVQLV